MLHGRKVCKLLLLLLKYWGIFPQSKYWGDVSVSPSHIGIVAHVASSAYTPYKLTSRRSTLPNQPLHFPVAYPGFKCRVGKAVRITHAGLVVSILDQRPWRYVFPINKWRSVAREASLAPSAWSRPGAIKDRVTIGIYLYISQ